MPYYVIDLEKNNDGYNKVIMLLVASVVIEKMTFKYYL